jgi:Zn-dependent M32 family carboxypeptidase
MPIFLISKLITINSGDEDYESTRSEPIGYFNGCAEEAIILCDRLDVEIEHKKIIWDNWLRRKNVFHRASREKIQELQSEFKILKKEESALLEKITGDMEQDDKISDVVGVLKQVKKGLKAISDKIFETETGSLSDKFLKDNPEPENVQDVIRYDYMELREVK